LGVEDGRATGDDVAMGRTASLRAHAAARLRARTAVGAIVVITACLAVASTAGAGARPAPRCLVPGAGKTIDQLWRPDMAAAIAYAHTRVGDIAFAVRTAGRFYGYRPDHQEWSASVVKAMLLVTYLDSAPVRNRTLTARDTSVLGPMIRVSDNDDAQIIFDTVGQAGLRALAQRVGMTGFATNPVWGETHITARDQTRFFLHIDDYVVARHRSYAMRLLRSIAPADRWGIGELPQPGWKLYFKGGWGYGTGLEDHQVALLVRGCARVSLAVLTMYDGSHPYGKATEKAIFARLLRGFPTAGRSHAPSSGEPAPSRALAPPATATASTAAGRRVVIGTSVRGRPIVAHVLGSDSAPRKLLLVGCIHGNECAGVRILSALMRRRAPPGVQLWLVPEMNPDGTAADTRQNAHGVDLNRNFPYQWERVTDPTYDSGPRPASEPETRAAMALIRRIKPAVTVWYHQHMDLVDMAGGDRGVARRYAQLSGLHATCLSFLPGTAPAWSNRLLPGTTAFVVELPAGPVGSAALARHLRAVRAMEAGQRSGSRTSCRG
jgi:murein peptide amidase A